MIWFEESKYLIGTIVGDVVGAEEEEEIIELRLTWPLKVWISIESMLSFLFLQAHSAIDRSAITPRSGKTVSVSNEFFFYFSYSNFFYSFTRFFWRRCKNP